MINIWPLWEDRIIVKTWPNGTDKLFALRNYEVKYPDGRHIAIRNIIVVNPRPDDQESTETRFNIESIQHQSAAKKYSPLRYASKIEPATDSASVSPGFRVKVSDLDVNLHTNNVST